MTARPLDDSELIVGAAPIGVVAFDELAVSGGMDLPSRRRILDGPELVVTRPGGEPVAGRTVVAQVESELGERLGGWFASELDPAIRLYDSLADADLHALARSPGTVIALEAPRSAYYFLAFERDGWLVQAVGEPADFHCVSLSRPLSEAEALGPGGHPRPQPAGPPEQLLAQAAPALDLGALRDVLAQHDPGLYDAYLSGDGVAVKAGVRLRVGPDNSEPVGVEPYLYAVRVNFDLVGS